MGHYFLDRQLILCVQEQSWVPSCRPRLMRHLPCFEFWRIRFPSSPPFSVWKKYSLSFLCVCNNNAVVNKMEIMYCKIYVAILMKKSQKKGHFNTLQCHIVININTLVISLIKMHIKFKTIQNILKNIWWLFTIKKYI